MPVFLITIHAYRSWNADHPRGYVRHGKGILPPNTEQAKAYDKRAADLPALFGDAEQAAIASIAADACVQRDWRLHAIALEPSHVHVLVSWNAPMGCAGSSRT